MMFESVLMIKSELINVLSRKLPEIEFQNIELSVNCMVENIA
jgi:hypothetical protein